MNKIVFKSKIDTWLVFVLVVALLILGYAAMTSGLSAITTLFFIISSAFITSVLFNTKYTLENDQLIVQSGFLNWSIQVKDITSIESTHNPISSPALALDRLQVNYKNKRVLISPKEKNQFINALKKMNSSIKVINS